jgi:sterol desaturase/sphingolipid hydroxylase (fatty acid hydroxylase superfamily)
MWNWVLDKLLIGPAVSVIMALLSLGLSIDLAQLLTGTFGAHAPMLEATWAIVAIQFIVLLLGAELGGYIAHRLLHEVPLLWSIHRAHHSPEALNFFTNSRDHPLELLMNSVFRGVATSILLGVTLYVTGTSLLPQSLSAFIFFLVFIYSSYAYLSHSHIPMSFGKLNIVLAGPIMHQIHHSAEEHMFDKNYGRTIHIFDWMFGTLYMPRKGESFRFGLNDYSMGKDNPHRNLKQFYFEPFMHMAETWRGQRAAKRSETGKMVANGASDDRAEFPGVNN